MSSANAYIDPLEELRLLPQRKTDLLPAMLFLAALLHGILIIGVAFNPALSDTWAEAISLEVTIVADPDQHIDRPDDAEYLAQASQQGGGNTSEAVRPSASEISNSPIDNLGREHGDSFEDSTRHERAADELLASTRADQPLPSDPRREPVPDETVALALEQGSDTTLPLPREDKASELIHDDDPRQLVISADTREAGVAPYLDRWKRRIEAVGADYFPQLAAGADISGSPTLEVSIYANGELADVIIRKSSGSAVIDQAALDILRRASPFDPFPAEVANDYDSLRFAYKWLFAGDRVPRTASTR